MSDSACQSPLQGPWDRVVVTDLDTEPWHVEVFLTTLESHWRDAVRIRRGSAADRLLALLIAHPVVRVADVTVLLSVSRQAAVFPGNQLAGSCILRQVDARGSARLFEATAVFNILTDLERKARPRSALPARKDVGAVPGRRTT